MPGDQDPLDSSQKLTERLDVNFAIQAAGLGVWEYDPVSRRINWDQQCRGLFGLTKDNPMSYEQALAYIHPDDVARIDRAVQQVMIPGSDTMFDQTYRTLGVDDGKLRWVRFQGRVDFTATGEVQRFAGVAQDVTQQMVAQQTLENSRQQVLNSFEHAPFAVAVLIGPALTYQMTNALYRQLVSRTADQLLGKPMTEVIPEVKGQGFVELLQQVIKTGIPYEAKQTAFQIHQPTGVKTAYFDFTYQPWQENGRVTGVMIVATEVTQQVQAQQLMEESRAQLRSVIEETPVAVGLHVGAELRIELANDTQLSYWGRDRSVLGKPFREVLPELEGQGFFELFDQAYATGQSYQGVAAPAQLSLNGKLGTYYFDYSFKPIRNEQGQVYAVLNTAIDVTQQVVARQQREQTQQQLQQAVDLAELATWSVDVPNGQVNYSERYHEWMGLGQTVGLDHAFDAVAPAEATGIEAAYRQAISPGSTGRLEAEFSVANIHTGTPRLIRIVGQMQPDHQGQPLSINGFAQDVTQLRASQQALEGLVAERTKELAASIEQLEEANHLLTHSNENLQTFAYVASHDLQEPLRKIQQFGDLLKARFSDSANGEELGYLERIQSAASRMSTLIKDLLSFSRISTQRNTEESTSLGAVVDKVLSTLDVIIEETGAQVQVDTLPTVSGDAGQLEHLFQNLLSNALKFHRAGIVLRIHIRSQTLTADRLPPTIKPARKTLLYHRIEVSDNGIGFDEKYLDRIFQVFQRLHGKSQYAGTGIGLAICEKIAVNHGGAITASSQSGQGATFIVYLPIED